MYTCYIQSFKILASFSSGAGWFVSYLVGNPEDRFSRDVAHIIDGFEEKVQTSETDEEGIWG